MLFQIDSFTCWYVGTWFCNEGIPLIHKHILQEINLRLISCVLIDSTALRSSLYDGSRRMRGIDLVMVDIRAIKLMSVCLYSANVHDSKMAPCITSKH